MPMPLPANTNFLIVKRALDSGYSMPILEASSDYYEAGYILSGDRLCITPEGSYAMNTGMVGTMPPFIYHRTIPLSDRPYNTYLIKFTPDFVRPLTDAFSCSLLDEIYSQMANRFSTEMSSRILMYFQEMYDIYQSNSRYGSFRLQCMLCDLLLAILENRLPNDTDSNTVHAASLTPPVIDALTYMEQHYYENPSLETVALLSGYSASHFSRLFHAQLGKPYSEYLTKIRIRHVQDLLLNTKKSVTEIALETGYLHTGNLSEQFKQQTGMTPLQYRKAHMSTPVLS